MTKRKLYKRHIRERMANTGQTFTAAAADAAAERRPSGPPRKDGRHPTTAPPRLTLTFVGWLAGRGTTTQALYSSLALAELGLNVTLLDCNPTLDLLRISRAVPDLPFVIKRGEAGDVAPRDLSDGSDVVVIDAPALGRYEEIAYNCVGHADEIVVPVLTARHECEAVLPIKILRRVRPNARLCAFLWSHRPNSRSIPSARARLTAAGLDVLDPVVHDRTAYS